MKWMVALSACLLIALIGFAVVRGGSDPPPVLGQVPAFSLVDKRGADVASRVLEGSPWVANFIFTSCPSFCPRLTEQMKKVHADLPAGIGAKIVSFSVDPANDTPEKLADYARRFSVDVDDWLFLTGERRTVYELVREGFKLAVEERSPDAPDDGQGIIIHSDRFVLVDGKGRIRGYYRGQDDESLRELSHAVIALANE